MKKKDNSSINMKEEIKNYAEEIGVDDIGFASLENYKSPNTPPVKEIFPKAKTIIVLAFEQLDNCESENIQIASMGNLAISDFAHSSTYKIARFIKKESGSKVMNVIRGPVNMDKKTRRPFADVSLRHAAVAAGLGRFGKHNLVIHPEIGTKVIFTAIITDLDISPDTPLEEELCLDCDICVKLCPVNALSQENKTDVAKCSLKSQPYGLSGNIQFWMKFAQSNPEDQKMMLLDEKFVKLCQSLSLGSYYVCSNCIKSCPVGS